MKKYKLLKDLPFAKAGEIFELNNFVSRDFLKNHDTLEDLKIIKEGDNLSVKTNFVIKNVSEWFKEIKNQTYYYLSAEGDIMSGLEQNDIVDLLAECRKSIGNYFATRQQAEKALAKREAEVILRKDTKGFVPDWNGLNKPKYNVFYSCYSEKLHVNDNLGYNHGVLYFKTEQDALESIEKHEKEWKIYLGVE